MQNVLDKHALQGLQVPRLESSTPTESSSATETIELAAAYGLVLDPWQQRYLHGALNENEGQWVTTRNGLSVPRQQGKSAVMEARELAGLILFPEKLIIHSAHEIKTSAEAFRRMKSYFENYDDLAKMVLRISARPGEETIELKDGSRLRFMARSRNSTRGFSVDTLMMDEAQELGEEAYATARATTIARTNTQIWLFGTPPAPSNNGVVFTQLRNVALSGKDSRVYYAEHSADPDLDYDDREGWKQALPALGKRGVDMQSIQDARHDMSDDNFAREILGIWGGPTKHQVIAMDVWALRATPLALPEDTDTLAMAVDVAPDRSTASVALAGIRSDGKHHIEVLRNLNGVGWTVDYVAGVCARRAIRAVVIDPAGPAATLIDPLKAKGVPVRVLTNREAMASAGAFYDGVMEEQIVHLDDPILNSALGAARKRTVGDSWAWHRKNNTDITPLVAVTFANYGLTLPVEQTQKPKYKPPRISTRSYSFR